MVLDLTGLFAEEGKRFEVEPRPDLSGEDLPGAAKIREPVRTAAVFENRAGIVTVKGCAYPRVEGPCDRCAEPTVRELTVPFFHVLVVSAENEESDDTITVPDMKLDLDELVRCDVLLALPAKHLCREDCKGLCPKCGKDLNEGPCGCKNTTDPRLEPLLRLLD